MPIRREVSIMSLYIWVTERLMHALNSKYGTLIQGVDYYETWDKGKFSGWSKKIFIKMQGGRAMKRRKCITLHWH